MIHVMINGERYEYPDGTSLLYIAEDMQSDYANDIVLAFVDGRLRELFHEAPDGAELRFVTTGEKIGAETYQRGVIFLMIRAFRDVYGEEVSLQLFVDYQIGNGLFVRLRGGECTDEMLDAVSDRMMQLVRLDLPFSKESISTRRAVQLFCSEGMDKKAKLFTYRRASETNVYHLGDLPDYYYAYMVPSTGYIKGFDLMRYRKGILLMLPRIREGSGLAYIDDRKLYSAFEETQKWQRLLEPRAISMTGLPVRARATLC